MPQIVDQVSKYLQTQSTRYPTHANRASEIGHPCTRMLVYKRTRWEESLLPDARTQAIFRMGRTVEEYALELMKAAGLCIIEQQSQMRDQLANLTGHVDAIAYWPETPEKRFVVEIKSAAPHIWARINTIADFNFKPWLMKYPAQIQSYMYFKSYTTGVIVVVNKSTGWPKEIWCSLDLDYMDGILKKCDQINQIVDLLTSGNRTLTEADWEAVLPERVKDLSICEMCDFRHICRPEVTFGAGLKVSDDPLFDEKVKRLVEGQAQAAEISHLADELKQMLKNEAEAGGQADIKYVTPEAFITGKRDSRGAWRFKFEAVNNPDPEAET